MPISYCSCRSGGVLGVRLVSNEEGETLPPGNRCVVIVSRLHRQVGDGDEVAI